MSNIFILAYGYVGLIDLQRLFVERTFFFIRRVSFCLAFVTHTQTSDTLFDARPGRSRRRLLSAQERNARPRQRCCRRPGAPSDETNTSGQLSFSAAFFSYPTIVSFTAGVAGVFSALHHMRKAWCKQKKVWVHGFFLCRERPAWWGALAENIPRIVHVSKCARVKHVVYDAASRNVTYDGKQPSFRLGQYR